MDGAGEAGPTDGPAGMERGGLCAGCPGGRIGVSIFVLSCITSLPWTTRLSLDFFRSRVSVSMMTKLAGKR